jgi:signal transduction histidine kinase/CheY-like chemotaxis protein
VKLKKIKIRLLRFLFEIGTSGRYKEEGKFSMSDYLIRYVLMNSIIILGSVILAGFIVLNVYLNQYFTAAACAAMIVMALVSFVLARTKIRQIIPAAILMISYALLCVFITWTGESDGANFLFMFVYPLLTIMLLGMSYGIALSVILGVIISLEMFIPGITPFYYKFDLSIRMLVNYFLVFAVMVVIESTRKTKDRQIKKQNSRLHELKLEADAASRTKSNFLASMSHEIRTPMNAITGMAELLLRSNLSDDARTHAQDIKQAGNNLISIINDILDFSKIEAGRLEIVPVKYLLASLVNDSVNIIRMRIGEKPLRFFTNIDGDIPNSLIGDEIRLRQIILNMLSNAVKYTEKGHIGLSIMTEKREDKRIWLKIMVTDTGMGIKPEDQEKLFKNFIQVDTKKNRGIEGTGLGLAITRQLCLLMEGNITVESEYGKGSVFTVIIPQGIYSHERFAAVSEPENKNVLVYEGRICYAQSMCWSLENLKVPYTMVTNKDDFTAALLREKWFFVFSGYGLYDQIKPFIEKPESDFSGGKRPPLALMVEWGTEAFIPGVRFVSLPIQSLSVANTLNGKADSRNYLMDSGSSGAVRFAIPSARLLVVDDIATNLKVAEGLLAPYRAEVDTCLSGEKAIEFVKLAALQKRGYDIIFMDHMMPEMDGVETTAAIRALEGESFRTVPIIALTANAVTGMREMFAENGFNDFLAKPIDISKLDDILNHWVPKEKREINNEQLTMSNEQLAISRERGRERGQVSDGIHQSSLLIANCSLSTIPGVDTAKGVSLTGGTLAAYRQVLSLFCKDAEDRIPILQKTAESEDTLPAFVTHVHSLKSASASIGAQNISAQAAGLEAVGRAGDAAFIRESLPDFLNQLEELVKRISAALETGKNSNGAE